MNDLFFKNTQALFEVDQILAVKLRSIQEFKKFELVKTSSGINIKFNNQYIYDNPNKDILKNINIFKNNFDNYPTLFFYGFGNGAFYKLLLENENHKRIIVFEEEIEILALAFCMYDFSKDIKEERLIIFQPSILNTAILTTLFSYENIQNSLKIYNLHVYNQFYNKFYANNIDELNKKIIQIIRFITLSKGNDPKDSLVGIKHLLINLPKMLNHGIFKKFIKDAKFKSKNAIIVSTGPSLTKQLPLLKQYQNNASIFCADSAYPILAKEGIKPDYVLSLERVDFTSEFFNNDFGEFDKDILFVIASLTHPNTIKYLDKNGRDYMLVSRPLIFASSLKLHEFGYIGTGASVANMAYELAGSLRFENIIFIGQDLAYGKDKVSHPKEYLYGEHDLDEEGLYKENLKTIAYGGEGEVITSTCWNLFKNQFEKDISLAKMKLNINTYNCTEGGARIQGTIEEPFKDVCERLLNKKIKKSNIKLKFLNKEKSKEKLLKIKNHLEKSINDSEKFIQKIQKNIKNYENNKDFKIIKQNLEKLRKAFPKKSFYNEIFQAMYFHNELEVVRMNAIKINDDEFLKKQIYWYKVLIEYLNTQNKTIKDIVSKYKI